MLDNRHLPQAEHQADPRAAQLPRDRTRECETRRSRRSGFAGPETLLLGLRKTVKFDLKEEGELDGIESLEVPRHLEESRKGLVGLDGRPVAAGGFLPPYIPMDGTLYLGKEDGWPYKLVPRGPEAHRSSSRRAASGPTAGPSAQELDREDRPQ